MATPEIDDVLAAWQPYIHTIDNWQSLVEGVEPKPTGCGPVYELPNPIERPHESFAIADMRELAFAEPHYHTNGESEIYIVLTGLGTVVVGGKEDEVEKGSVSVTPPETAHFTIPKRDLVLAVINTPPFNANNAVSLEESDSRVGYDLDQLQRLVAEEKI